MSYDCSEKTVIRIKNVEGIVGKRVKVILPDNSELLLPISQAERYGDRIFIPTWLAEKMGLTTQIET